MVGTAPLEQTPYEKTCGALGHPQEIRVRAAPESLRRDRLTCGQPFRAAKGGSISSCGPRALFGHPRAVARISVTHTPGAGKIRGRVLAQHLSQELTSMRTRVPGDILGTALRDHPPAAVTAFGAHVYDPVG